MKKWILLCLILSVCPVGAVSAEQTRVQKTEGSAPLTQDEIKQIDVMEMEWAADIDNAVPFIRKKDYRSAGRHIKKATDTISRMKALLVKKGYVLSSIDRLVAMERLTEAYGNMAMIAGYSKDSRTLAGNAQKVQALFYDTRKKLLEARDKFHEVPPLQELCKQFLGILDEFEREMNMVLSRVSQ